jgi:hypothetical protein
MVYLYVGCSVCVSGDCAFVVIACCVLTLGKGVNITKNSHDINITKNISAHDLIVKRYGRSVAKVQKSYRASEV